MALCVRVSGGEAHNLVIPGVGLVPTVRDDLNLGLVEDHSREPVGVVRVADADHLADLALVAQIAERHENLERLVDRLHLAVKDDRVGLAAEVLDRVFDRLADLLRERRLEVVRQEAVEVLRVGRRESARECTKRRQSGGMSRDETLCEPSVHKSRRPTSLQETDLVWTKSSDRGIWC
jgi:hypothetical protein